MNATVRPYRFRLPRPLRTATGAWVHREGAVLQLTWDDGSCGMGEVAAWPGFGAGEAAVLQARPRVEAVLARALSTVPSPRHDLAPNCALGTELAWVQRHLRRVLGATADVQGAVDHEPTWTRGAGPNSEAWPSEWVHAVETALLDAAGRASGRSVARILCADAPPTLAVHSQVTSAVEAKDAVAAGATAVKVKVGRRELSEEGAHVAGVRVAAGNHVGLRLDANGAWPSGVALRALRMFAAVAPEWVEEPVTVGDVEALKALRAENAVPIALDESLSDEVAVQAALNKDLADVYVLKPMFVGGPSRTVALALAIARRGRGVCITHAMESPVGGLAAIHTAAAVAGMLHREGLGEFVRAGGLRPAFPTAGLVQPNAGTLAVPTLGGLGLVAQPVL